MAHPPLIQSLDRCPETGADDGLAAACRDLAASLGAGAMACLSVARERDDLAACVRRAGEIAQTADDVLVLGIGGSSLGARALLALAGGRGPRLHLVDNVDPHGWEAVLARLDPRRTHVLAVSKSGSTVETMAQALLAAAWAERGGRPLDRTSFTAITEPGPRALRALAERHGAAILDHDPAIGGRFSVLSVVGMLPAVIAGLDVAALREGALAVLDDHLRHGPSSAPARGAALAVALEDRGLTTHVLAVYADRLATFSRWYVQLWAESLGKGGRGSNPVAATGVTDQHSQLQLWLGGPRDKWLTVLGYPTAGAGPVFAGTGGLDYLDGRTLGDLFAAERDATVASLAAAAIPVRTMTVERVDERALGGLFMHFMIETILAGRLMGVDPFGQPAVEDGKARAREALAAMAR